MLIRGKCPHCQGYIFVGTLTKTISRDNPRRPTLDEERAAAPEVDHGEGEEGPDDLTRPMKKDDFSKNRTEGDI